MVSITRAITALVTSSSFVFVFPPDFFRLSFRVSLHRMVTVPSLCLTSPLCEAAALFAKANAKQKEAALVMCDSGLAIASKRKRPRASLPAAAAVAAPLPANVLAEPAAPVDGGAEAAAGGGGAPVAADGA